MAAAAIGEGAPATTGVAAGDFIFVDSEAWTDVAGCLTCPVPTCSVDGQECFTPFAAVDDDVAAEDTNCSPEVRRATRSSLVKTLDLFADFARWALSWRAISPRGTELVQFCAWAMTAPNAKVTVVVIILAVKAFMAHSPLPADEPLPLIYAFQRAESMTLWVKSRPSSLPGGGKYPWRWPESRKLSAKRGGRAAPRARVSCQSG